MVWKKRQTFDDAGIEVNPGKYMDLVITNALTILPKAIENGESMKSALLSLTISIDQLENICRANKLIEDDDEEYNLAVKKFVSELVEDDPELKRAKLANFKMRLLMQRAFESGIKEAELSV